MPDSIFQKGKPYINSGIISNIFISPRSKIRVPEWVSDKTSIHSLRQLDASDLDDFILDSAAFVITDLDELIEISHLFEKRNKYRIPYVFFHTIDEKVDPILLTSHIARASDWYSISANNVNFHLGGRYSEYDVTIIIPVYGVENYIERCVRSLINQKFSGRAEILFIDDGGKDKSPEIIERLIADQKDMRLIRKPNGGAASARNVGMRQAKGRYIGFIDGDDYVSPDYLDILYRAALLNDADISQAGFLYVEEPSGKTTPHKEYFPTARGNTGDIFEPAYEMMLQVPGIWRRLYKRTLIESRKIYFHEDFRRHDDLPFNVEVLTHANKIAVSREPVYYYILGRDGQDVSATDERLYIHFRLFDFLRIKLSSHYWNYKYFETYIRVIFSHHMWAYDRINNDLKKAYLEGVAQQVLRAPAAVGLYGRIKLLRQHFPGHRKIINKLLLISLTQKNKPLPSDI